MSNTPDDRNASCFENDTKFTPEEGERLAALATEPPTFPGLTPRERQVATFLALGFNNHEIADLLEIAVKTIDTHRGHILRKLEVRGNVALARLAIRAGWVSDSGGAGE